MRNLIPMGLPEVVVSRGIRPHPAATIPMDKAMAARAATVAMAVRTMGETLTKTVLKRTAARVRLATERDRLRLGRARHRSRPVRRARGARVRTGYLARTR
jgi:hypothetical protein